MKVAFGIPTCFSTLLIMHVTGLSNRVSPSRDLRIDLQADEDAFSRVNGSAEVFSADNLTAQGSVSHFNNSRPHVILGIGFPKCGSSFAWHVLSKAADVINGPVKELSYFEWPPISPKNACGKPTDGVVRSAAGNYVRACFGDEETTKGKKLLEFSPGYATFRGPLLDETIARLEEVAKDVNLRMIAVVRNPIHRAVSELNMFRDNGKLNGTDEELSQELHKELEGDVGSRGKYHVATGEYAEHLQIWMDRFPRESLLVVNHAALNDMSTWQRIFNHCGLDKPSDDWLRDVISKASKNERRNRADYLKISEKAHVELSTHYSNHNQELWKMLGTKPWW